MKNPVVETIELAIAAHKSEIKKYEAMLKAYTIGKVTVDEESSGRRGPKLGSKRGPYKIKSKAKSKWDLAGIAKRTISPKWDIEIPKVLKASGQALTTREIIDAIRPGSYSKSKRVLHARCGAIISIYKKQHKYVKEAGLKHGFQAYAAL